MILTTSLFGLIYSSSADLIFWIDLFFRSYILGWFKSSCIKHIRLIDISFSVWMIGRRKIISGFNMVLLHIVIVL